MQDGLSESTVVDIVEDSNGFIWMSTYFGINRFDGSTFKQYLASDEDSCTISNNLVLALHIDKKGTLWVGTNQGLDRYNHINDCFDQVALADKNGVQQIRKITNGLNDDLWISTGKHVIYHYNTQADTSQLYPLPEFASRSWGITYDVKRDRVWVSSLNSKILFLDVKTNTIDSLELGIPAIGVIKDIFIDEQHNLWVATQNQGIIYLNPDNGTILHHFTKSDNPEGGIQSNNIENLEKGLKNELWVASQDGGVAKINRSTFSVKTFKNNPLDPNSISGNIVRKVFMDKNNNLWIGQFNKGFDFHNAHRKPFKVYRHHPGDPNSISFNNILHIQEAPNGMIWVGTDGGGLNVLNPSTNSFRKVPLKDQYHNYSINSTKSISMLFDNEEKVWIGHYEGGLCYYDTQTGAEKWYIPENISEHGLAGENIWSLCVDQNKTMWVGTNKGLFIYDQTQDYFNQPTSIHQEINQKLGAVIRSLYVDRAGNIWIGSSKGCLKYSPKEEQYYYYLDKKNNINSTHDIVDFKETKKGEMFLIDRGGGLFLIDQTNHKLISKSAISDEIGTKRFEGIQEDHQGNLWISSNYGLTKYHPSTNEIEHFDTKNGLGVTQFYGDSECFTKDGKMYFGAIDGLVAFDPSAIKMDYTPPNLILNDLYIYNKRVVPGSCSTLDSALQFKKHLILDHDQTMVTIDFLAIEYGITGQNKFAYKMEGVDQEWNYSDNDYRANYTNLAPGKYQFFVKAANYDGYWTPTPTVLSITIKPPFWRTIWFIGGATLLIIALVFYLITYRTRALKKQKDILELAVKVRTRQLSEQKDEIMVQNEHLQELTNNISSQKNKLEEAYTIISQKNSEITKSIKYARQIQSTILPADQVFQKHFSEHFVIFQPKDIVSGDFYWIHENLKPNGTLNNLYIATIDCTGHGIPGAFLSLIAYEILQKIVTDEPTISPGKLLQKVHLNTVKRLKQKDHLNENIQLRADGMDIFLCQLTPYKHGFLLTMAGSKTLMFLKKKNQPFTIHRGERRYIGGFVKDNLPFAQKETFVEAGDFLYLPTDGLIDQQDKGRKRFGVSKMKNLLKSCQDLPMEEQGKVILSTINLHMTNTDQRDDITLIGIKI